MSNTVIDICVPYFDKGKKMNLAKNNILAIITLVTMFGTTSPKEFVTPQLGDRIIDLLIEVGDTLNENRSSIGEVITNATSLTITTSGNYILGENIDGTIIIDSNEVWLNLNGYTVYELSGTSTGIIINQDKTNITIFNGYIKGQGSSNGIGANQGTTALKVENVTISDFEYGIYLDGTLGSEIKECYLKKCLIHRCNKGISGNYIKKSIFQNCKAKNCFETGFELRNSNNNIFTKCQAVDIENNDADKDAVGFYDYVGNTNVFDECIACGINKIVNGYQTAGFLLTGNDITQTSGDKIINCLSNLATFSGDGFSFGILLEKALLEFQEIAHQDHPFYVYSVNWDPTGKYLAIGGFLGKEIRVFEFKPTEPILTNRLVEVANQDHPSIVYSVNWDPTGKYLAIGGTSGNEIRVFEFKPTEPILTNRLVEVANKTHLSAVYSVNWDPTGNYLAIGANFDGSDEETKVFEFKPTEPIFNNRLVEVANQDHPSRVESVNWDPTGKYLAVGAISFKELRIFEFKPTEPVFDNRLVEVANQDLPLSVNSANWDPTGKYLAIGRSGGNKEIGVLEFKPTEPILNNRLVEVVTKTHPSSVFSVNWDPTGKYLAIGGFSGDEIRVFEFKPTEPILNNRLVEIASQDHPPAVNSVNWDPTGQYLAIGGQDGNEIRVFLSFSLPENCIILNNEVGNGSGIGIEGNGINANLIAKNIGYNNPRNFTTGMFNLFSGGLNGVPGLMQNISVPPYAIIDY